MKVSAILAICIAGMAATSAFGYNLNTHEKMSRDATVTSVLATDPETLKSLGINLGLEQPVATASCGRS